MPIAQHKPTQDKSPVVNLPQVQSQKVQSIVVDTKYTPLQSLIKYVEGAAWTVTYYGQVIDKHNDVRSQDPTQSPVYQSYSEIKQLEIRVSTTLSESQDTTTNTMVVTGAAVIMPFMIPNVGDMFAADVGDGREGVFVVTNTEKKTILKDSVFEIEYTLLYFSDNEPNRRQDLINKTVNSSNYVRDFIEHGQKPILIDEEFNAYKELHHAFETLSVYYMNKFFSNEFQTLIIPGQLNYCYDHFLTKAVLAILSVRDAPQVRYCRRLNLADHEYIKQPTVWDSLLKREETLLTILNKKMGLLSVKASDPNPFFDSIRFLGISYFVYPIEPDISANNPMDKPPFEAVDFIELPEQTGVSTMDKTFKVAGIEVPIVKPVDTEYYILSQAFYDNTEGKSLLEVLIYDYLNKRAIPATTAMELVKQYHGWGVVERFYYIPMLLILIRSIIRNY